MSVLSRQRVEVLTQDQSGFAALVVHVVANATLRDNMITDWRIKLYFTFLSSWVFY